jgi:ABC-type sugar transport system ATPase subunit
MIFQEFALYPHLTVFENIAFGLKARRLPVAEVNSRVDEVTQALNLQPQLRRLPHELSGGERQRVAIARALARRPALLLMDEPLANLDPALRARFRSDLLRLRSRFEVTILYVTHDQSEAMALGDRLAVMNAGRVLQTAPPIEVYRRPANRFVAGFFGTPAINFLSGKLRRAKDVLWFEENSRGSPPLRIPVLPENAGAGLFSQPELEVVLGIRPEHVTISTTPPESTDTDLARVLAAHYAGHEYHVTVDRGGSSLTARVKVDDGRTPVVGDRVKVTLDPGRALLFDADGNNFSSP